MAVAIVGAFWRASARPEARAFSTHLLRPLIGLLLLSLLAGCSVSPARIRHADAVVAASVDRRNSCPREDHCAAWSPLVAASDDAFAASTPQHPQHLIALLDDAEPALVARLNLIRAAHSTIDVQTYIWDHDDAGMLMLDELVKAARRGVQVRILVDQLAAFGDIVLLDQLARVSPALEVRLYNPTFDKALSSSIDWVAGLLCCFHRFNQRMHNKLLVVDGRIGISGGRNYQNRYYGWDDEFDYFDRDVLLGGPTVARMQSSFERFWQHPRSMPLTHLSDVNHHLRQHPAALGWPTPVWQHPAWVMRAQAEADDPDWLEEHILTDSLNVGAVEFFSDLPGKTDHPERRQTLAFTNRLSQMIGAAQQEIVLQTPYLVLSGAARKVFRELHKRKPAVDVEVSTNSLASTDAYAVYALFFKHRKHYLDRLGLHIYEMKPHAPDALAANDWDGDDAHNVGPDGTRLSPRKKHQHVRTTETRPLFGSGGQRHRPLPLISHGRRVGLHAKSLVIDQQIAVVGSHNFDPRSDYYNTEAGVIVHDARFAGRLRDSILLATAPENAWVMAPRPQENVLDSLNDGLSELSSKLPLFDLWPFRYATDFQLKSGCGPLRPDDPQFYACYEPVGDFPDVAVSHKSLLTRLITAFGAGVQGVL